MRRILHIAVVLLLTTTSVLAQSRPGSFRGRIFDKKSGEEVPNAMVSVMSGKFIVAKGLSDMNGNVNINPIDPGTYTIRVTNAMGYGDAELQGVEIAPGRPTVRDISLSEASQTLGEVTVKVDRAPLVEKGKTSTTFNQDVIKNLPTRGLGGLLSLTASAVQNEATGGVSFRGGRENSNQVFIDGVKVRGSINLPREAIQQTEVITGGTPAQYGDVTGGVISTTTRGPSPIFFGTGEVVTSQLFDPYGYNLAGLTVGGPLWIKKNAMGVSRPIVGFLLSTEYEHNTDGRPYATPVYKVNDAKLAELEAQPILPTAAGLGTLRAGELLRMSDLEIITRRLNVANDDFRASYNLNIKPSRNVTVVFGGRFNWNQRMNGSFGNALMNYKNNSQSMNRDIMGYARFTQRFSGTEDNANDLIQNAYYTIQADFTRNFSRTWDPNLRDNIFQYGHVGTFETQRTNFYGYGVDPVSGLLGYHKLLNLDTNVVFTASQYNPLLANYTSSYYNLVNAGLIRNNTNNLVNIQQGGGLLNGQTPYSIYSLFNNVGAATSNYSYSQNDQFRITASTNFDIKGHSLIAGMEYEQRFDRAFSASGGGLWTLMRGLQNDAIRELDLSNPLPIYVDGVFQDTVNYNQAYDPSKPRAFDRNLRTKLGLNPNGLDLLDIDSYDPSMFNLDLFSARELLNFGAGAYVSYFGYDYTGNILAGNPSLSDFFRATDAQGNKTYPMAAFQPIYMAGYIQDQFTYKDLFFNVGVRVDRYDANQPALKDPFTLYSAYTVADVEAMGGLPGVSIPGSISKEAMVYVDNVKNPKKIVGYREGFNWFNADGSPQVNPKAISDLSGGQAKPWIAIDNFTDENNPDRPVLSEKGFKDYTPQITVSPRISFQFPISDVAEFFAHYDLLVQRPNENTRFNPVNYVNLEYGSATISNPDLKPQKQTEYEIGFRQLLNQQSALKINAFYREYRDLIQSISVTEAYPATYITYGNRDFTTAKGFSFQYDLRRTGNITVFANYTLSFADGTGSGSNSGVALARSGQPNLRYIQPLDFDVRHNFASNIDFRFGGGRDYNGPVWFDKKIFANAGINILATSQSGTPYSRRNRATSLTEESAPIVGLLNGSRLPWQTKVDLTANKVWYYAKGKKNFEMYLQVLNVMNQLNVLNVYPFTGSASDDGYLSSPQGQQALLFTTDAQSYTELYNLSMVSPFNYSIPRRIRLGVRVGF